MSENIVDLTKLQGRVYAGRPNGEAAREYFGISKMANTDKNIIVIFPEDARTITTSFFIGMFGDSVISSGSKEKFLERFHFVANKHILDLVDLSIKEFLVRGK